MRTPHLLLLLIPMGATTGSAYALPFHLDLTVSQRSDGIWLTAVSPWGDPDQRTLFVPALSRTVIDFSRPELTPVGRQLSIRADVMRIESLIDLPSSRSFEHQMLLETLPAGEYDLSFEVYGDFFGYSPDVMLGYGRATFDVVPEPSAAHAFAVGLALLACWRERRP